MKPPPGPEPHVVGVEAIGKDDVSSARHCQHIRKVVVVSIGIVEKSTVLAQKPSRIDGGGGAGVPTDRPATGRRGDSVNRFGDDRPLAILRHPRMGFPTIPVTRDFVAAAGSL